MADDQAEARLPHPTVACRPRRQARCTASSIRRCCAARPCCTRRSPSGRRCRREARRAGADLWPRRVSETHWALEDVIAEIEGGTRCQIVCSGLAAVTTPLLAFLKAGDHCLMPDSVYGPARNFADGMLQRFGVETTFYDPVIDEAGHRRADAAEHHGRLYRKPRQPHLRGAGRSGASPRAAHARGAKVLMDNTWGIHHFQPFTHGVDVSIQAADEISGRPFRRADRQRHGELPTRTGERCTRRCAALGQYASPDDCWLTPARHAHDGRAAGSSRWKPAIEVAHWLSRRPEVKQVLHPALPGAPGHALWKRDFTGACSLFGVEFKPEFSPEARTRSSRRWSCSASARPGAASKAWRCRRPASSPARPAAASSRGPVVRLHIGLEDVADLIADLEQGLEVMRAFGR